MFEKKKFSVVLLVIIFIILFNLVLNYRDILQLFGINLGTQTMGSYEELEEINNPKLYSSSKIKRQCDTYNKPYRSPPIAPFHWQDSGLITLWFDDAWESQFYSALPIMNAYGFKGALSIAVKLICLQQFMTWNEVHDVQALGWEMTSHSMSHDCNLKSYTKKNIEYELVESKQELVAHGIVVNHFVTPCGYGKSEMAVYFKEPPPLIDFVQKNYSSLRTTQTKRINPLPVLDPYSLNAMQIRQTTTDQDIQDAINIARAKKAWLILVFHQIDDSKRAFSISKQRFASILDRVKASGLPVVLPSQALSIKQENN